MRKLYTVVDRIDGHYILLYRGCNPRVASVTAQMAGSGAVFRAFPQTGTRVRVR